MKVDGKAPYVGPMQVANPPGSTKVPGASQVPGGEVLEKKSLRTDFKVVVAALTHDQAARLEACVVRYADLVGKADTARRLANELGTLVDALQLAKLDAPGLARVLEACHARAGGFTWYADFLLSLRGALAAKGKALLFDEAFLQVGSGAQADLPIAAALGHAWARRLGTAAGSTEGISADIASLIQLAGKQATPTWIGSCLQGFASAQAPLHHSACLRALVANLGPLTSEQSREAVRGMVQGLETAAPTQLLARNTRFADLLTWLPGSSGLSTETRAAAVAGFCEGTAAVHSGYDHLKKSFATVLASHYQLASDDSADLQNDGDAMRAAIDRAFPSFKTDTKAGATSDDDDDSGPLVIHPAKPGQ